MLLKSQDITIEHLTKKYKQKIAIEDLSISLKEGYLHIIIGENGSGKSTLLKCIMGIIQYQGKINVPYKKIGYAPENYILPEHLTIRQFLIAIGRLKRTNSRELIVRLNEYLKRFDLSNDIDKPIKYLSNGMKQKINLIQALIHQPKVLLLDEPFRAIDELAQQELAKILDELVHSSFVIISTHQPTKIKTRKKKVYQMNHGRIWLS